MPFSHYVYMIVDGKRHPVLLCQYTGMPNNARRTVIHRANDKLSWVARIPDACQPATDLETFRAKLHFTLS